MISVIIPTYNEAKTIEQTLKRLKGHECIVVDAGSTDDTLEKAKRYTKKVYTGKRGRAFQMNYGASKATKNILLFLHADTKATKKHLEAIKDCIKQGYDGGRFPSKYKDTHPLLKSFYFFSRQSLFSFIGYGNQGIFCTRKVFKQLKGYKKIELMEDIDFFFRLWKKAKVKIINPPLFTSGRRFQKGGYWKIWSKMVLMHILYIVGVKPKKLAELYYKFR